MKNVGIRYLFAIALAALAIQACAKKDDAVRARKDQAKETQDKTLADNKSAAEKAAAAADAAKKGPAAEDAAPAQDGGQAYQTACKDQTLGGPGKNKESLNLEDLLRGGKTNKLEMGTYNLIQANYFTEYKSKDGSKVNSVFAGASQVPVPADMTADITVSNKVIVNCHTSKKSTDAKTPGALITAAFKMPNTINLEDGAVSIFRQDTVAIKNGDITATSILTKSPTNLKDMEKGKNPAMEVSYIGQTENKFMIQTRIVEDGTAADGTDASVTRVISATYEKQ
jgi:hypothetical protein